MGEIFENIRGISRVLKTVLLCGVVIFGFVSCVSDEKTRLPELCVEEVKGTGILKIDLIQGEITSMGVDSIISGYHFTNDAYGYLWPFPISIPTQNTGLETWLVGDVKFTSSLLSDHQIVTSEFSGFGFDQPPVRSIVTLNKDGTGFIKDIIVQEKGLNSGKPITIFSSCGPEHLSLESLKTVVKMRTNNDEG